jgi:hypothetical protein
MHIPWILSFWMTIAAYVIHVLDESLLGGSFVEKVREHWWPQYSWRKFFWLNAAYFVVMFASVVVFDRFGGPWVILPLAWVIERFCNSIWHVWWSIHFREYSPGLVSCILIWMNTYFVVFYREPPPSFTSVDLRAAAAIGLTFAAFLAFYIPLVKGRAVTRK